jgi:SAM-dependent methyltransferase
VSAAHDDELHPLVGGFSDAAVYDAGRPRYDAAAAALLVRELGLAPGAPVLELGAGTGQLSVPLLEAGLDLTAVEPLAGTRELLARAIGPERVREGRAEAIPLEAATVDAVFAADSFHWFDETRAMPEIKRVLRPGGGVAILRMTAKIDDPWSTKLGEILFANRPQHPVFDGRGAAAALEQDAAFGPVLETSVTSPAARSREQMLAWIASFSWVAVLADAERERLLARVQELLESIDDQELPHEVLAQIWLARLRQ